MPRPLPVAVGPRKKGGPDSNFGVAPAQVRSGQARSSADVQTAQPGPQELARNLEWERRNGFEIACRKLSRLPTFCTDHRRKLAPVQ